MPLAKDIAIELRKLADSLDRQPETELTKPTIYFSSWSSKQHFLNAAKILPRPLKKTVETGQYPDICLDHETPSLNVHASVEQSTMCELVQPAVPAVYRCAPLLSEEEDAALSAEGGQ